MLLRGTSPQPSPVSTAGQPVCCQHSCMPIGNCMPVAIYFSLADGPRWARRACDPPLHRRLALGPCLAETLPRRLARSLKFSGPTSQC